MLLSCHFNIKPSRFIFAYKIHLPSLSPMLIIFISHLSIKKKNSKINDQEPQSVTLEVKWWYTALLVLSDLELCQFSKQTINVS